MLLGISYFTLCSTLVRNLFSRLITIINDKGWFIHIQMCWSCWIVKISCSIWTTTICTFAWPSNCIYYVSTTMESLFNLLLILLADKVLNLLLRLWLCLGAWSTILTFLLLLHQNHIDISSLTFLLHLLIFYQKLLFKVIILLLLSTLIFLPITSNYIRGSSLQLIFNWC